VPAGPKKIAEARGRRKKAAPCEKQRGFRGGKSLSQRRKKKTHRPKEEKTPQKENGFDRRGGKKSLSNPVEHRWGTNPVSQRGNGKDESASGKKEVLF